jgi:hypothetical protein
VLQSRSSCRTASALHLCAASTLGKRNAARYSVLRSQPDQSWCERNAWLAQCQSGLEVTRRRLSMELERDDPTRLAQVAQEMIEGWLAAKIVE